MLIKQSKPKRLGKVLLNDILDKTHSLCRLADSINWDWLVDNFGKYYHESHGRPGIPIRIMVGLHYLKYLEEESDESVVEKFCENPYWQYFCGLEEFVHRLPCNPSSLSKWRKKVGESGIEQMLKATLDLARSLELLSERHFERLILDTTVQEKAISYPTDAKLCHLAREHLVKACQKRSITLRQSFARKSKVSLVKQGRYAHARQMKRAKKERKKIKTYLGCVIRDIKRKVINPDKELLSLLHKAEIVCSQKRTDKDKLYSLWAPEVKCIAKGKAHKKYEYGCKVAVAVTANDSWVVSSIALDGNPYDGHTVDASINSAEKNTGVRAKHAFVDRGYKGNKNYPKDIKVYVSGQRQLKAIFKKILRSRPAIEPVIGHLKNDYGMSRNKLHGCKGDKINATLSGCAFNIKKIINYFKSNNKLAIT